MKKLLDLFCCCGGISEGFARNGFECTGVDITDTHNYKQGNFIHSDVFKLPMSFFDKFDLIHASPPCQGYVLTNKNNESEKYSSIRFIDRIRDILLKTRKPFIIENVVGSPLRKDIMLCGEMFGLRVIRHRIFEINGFTVLQPPHIKHRLSIKDGTATAIYSGGINPGFWGNKEKQVEYRQKRKALKKPTVEDWKTSIDIDWVNDKKHLTQMIPPAYSEYISRFL